MTRAVRNTGLAAGLAVAASAAALSQSPQPGLKSDDMPVMSDTAAGCAHLSAAVAARQKAVGPRPAADRLAGEGRRLCATGHIRPGIIRLRYALGALSNP